MGFVFRLFRRKWGLPGFRKSSQGKLGEAPSPFSSGAAGSSISSSNNKLPPPFRKSHSDKKFKVVVVAYRKIIRLESISPLAKYCTLAQIIFR